MPRRNKGIFSAGFSVARVKEDTRMPRRQDSLTDVIRRNTVQTSFPNPYTRGVFEQRFVQQSLFGFFNPNLYLSRNLYDQHHNYYDDDDDDDDDYNDDDDDDDYEDDEDEYEDAVWAQSSTPSPLPPHPSLRLLTQEEADKHTKEVEQREQRLKAKLERRRLKKQRQKEKKRLETEEKNKEGLCEVEPNQPSGSHDADIINNESEIIPEQSDVTAETEDKSLDGDCTSEDPVEPRTAATIKRFISPSPRGQSDSPRGQSDSPRGQSDSPRGQSDSPRGQSDSPRGQSDSPVPRERNGGGGGGRRRRKKTTTSRERRVPEREEPPDVPQTPPLLGADQQETNGTPEDYSQKTTELAACGHRLASCGQYEQALEYFTEAIKYNPKEYKLFGNRSLCYERLQQYAPALRDAEQALSLEPGWTKGLFRQGKALCGLQRYHDASLTYKIILQQEGSSEEATRELKRAQTLHLMEMGFSWAEACEALTEHGSLEEALEALFVGGAEPEEGSCRDTTTQQEEEEEEQEEQEPGEEDDGWTVLGRSRPHQARRRNAASQAVTGAPKCESYSVWVGSLSPTLTTPALHQLFSRAGDVTNVKVLVEQRCAFVDYARTEQCDRAIQLLNGFVVEGVPLAVRYPNRFLSEMNGQHGYPLPLDRNSKECYYWRTNGCSKLVGCIFQHIPEHKHIDRGKPGH